MGGIYLIRAFRLALTEEVKVIHGRHFSGDQYVFLQMDALENEEVFLWKKVNSGLRLLNGYYIYYEKMKQCRRI